MQRTYPLETWIAKNGVEPDEMWAIACDDCGRTLKEGWGDELYEWVMSRGHNKYTCPHCGGYELLAVYQP